MKRPKTENEQVYALGEALESAGLEEPWDNGFLLYRILRAAIKASVPGRQNKKNIAPAVAVAVRAACRTIRRSK